jgi:hypothetical protein
LVGYRKKNKTCDIIFEAMANPPESYQWLHFRYHFRWAAAGSSEYPTEAEQINGASSIRLVLAVAAPCNRQAF